MRYRISSVADLKTWAENCLDVDGPEASAVARAVWGRPDFPHPVNGADLTDYLAGLDREWLLGVAGEEREWHDEA